MLRLARLINMNDGGGQHNQGRRRLSTAAPGFAIVRGSLNLKFAHGESEELMSATGYGAQRDCYWS